MEITAAPELRIRDCEKPSVARIIRATDYRALYFDPCNDLGRHKRPRMKLRACSRVLLIAMLHHQVKDSKQEPYFERLTHADGRSRADANLHRWQKNAY